MERESCQSKKLSEIKLPLVILQMCTHKYFMFIVHWLSIFFDYYRGGDLGTDPDILKLVQEQTTVGLWRHEISYNWRYLFHTYLMQEIEISKWLFSSRFFPIFSRNFKFFQRFKNVQRFQDFESFSTLSRFFQEIQYSKLFLQIICSHI